jgi:hypothetical protein
MNKNLASTDASSTVGTTTPSMTYLPAARAATAEAVNDGQWARVPRMLRGVAARARGMLRSLRSLGPYLAIEVLLPGGSIIALALWTYRRRRAARSDAGATSAPATSAEPRARLRCVASRGPQ